MRYWMTQRRGMCRGVCALWLVAWCALNAGAVTVEIAPDGMAVVDGERVFILGLYEHPEDDGALERVAEAGFNLVQAGERVEELDRLDALGLWAWVNTGMKIDLSENREARTEALGTMVDTLGAHPALAVWEVPDEALWNTWYQAQRWRREREPAMLSERIDRVEDEARRDALRAELRRSAELRELGEYAESERMADALWEALGEVSPHPGYGLADAPERAEKLAQGLERGCALLRERDPGRVVWMNHAPRNEIAQLARFNVAADVVGCDIYPVPESLDVKHSDLGDRTLSSVGAYTRRMQAAAPDKPVWMVLQGFGWGDLFTDRDEETRAVLRRPTRAETRFMAYDAIVHGARGILYWGTFTVEKDAVFWDELLEVVGELHALQPVLSAPEAELDLTVGHRPTYGSVDRGITATARAAPDGVWLLVVNAWTSPLRYVLGGLDALEGGVYEEMETGVRAEVSGGELSLPMRRQSVHVLRPAP